MKIDINYSSDGKTYVILKDGKQIISCDSSVDPNYALEAFGIVFNSDSKIDAPDPIVKDMTLDEDYVQKIISEVKFDTPNLVKTNEALGGSIDLSKKDNLHDSEFDSMDVDKLPIKLNQKVYVNDVDGVLSSVEGGLGTINMIWIDPNSDNKVQTGVSYNEHDDDDEIDEEPIIEGNIMISIAETPGKFYNWSLLKDEQTHLKYQHGNKPAKIIYPVSEAKS